MVVGEQRPAGAPGYPRQLPAVTGVAGEGRPGRARGRLRPRDGWTDDGSQTYQCPFQPLAAAGAGRVADEYPDVIALDSAGGVRWQGQASDAVVHTLVPVVVRAGAGAGARAGGPGHDDRGEAVG